MIPYSVNEYQKLLFFVVLLAVTASSYGISGSGQGDYSPQDGAVSNAIGRKLLLFVETGFDVSDDGARDPRLEAERKAEVWKDVAEPPSHPTSDSESLSGFGNSAAAKAKSTTSTHDNHDEDETDERVKRRIKAETKTTTTPKQPGGLSTSNSTRKGPKHHNSMALKSQGLAGSEKVPVWLRNWMKLDLGVPTTKKDKGVTPEALSTFRGIMATHAKNQTSEKDQTLSKQQENVKKINSKGKPAVAKLKKSDEKKQKKNIEKYKSKKQRSGWKPKKKKLSPCLQRHMENKERRKSKKKFMSYVKKRRDERCDMCMPACSKCPTTPTTSRQNGKGG